MAVASAFNFKKWIDENRDNLKPPVNNKKVFEDGDFIIMVVGGPNQRKAYHFNHGEEFFSDLPVPWDSWLSASVSRTKRMRSSGTVRTVAISCMRSSFRSRTSSPNYLPSSKASTAVKRTAPATSAAQ